MATITTQPSSMTSASPSEITTPAARMRSTVAPKESSCNFVQCMGTMSFGLNHCVSMSVIALGLSSSSYLLGGLGVANLIAGGLSHRLWSKYADLSRAAEKVSGAVIEARKASGILHSTVERGDHAARTVGLSLEVVESQVERIQQVVNSNRDKDLKFYAEEFKHHAEDIQDQNQDFEELLEEFKTMISPLLGMIGNIRNSSLEIRKEFATGIPRLDELEKLEKRFETLTISAKEDMISKAGKIREIFKEMTELMLVSFQMLRDNNKILVELLEENTTKMQQTADHLGIVSENISQKEEEKLIQLLFRLERQEEENFSQQKVISDVVKQIDAERSAWDSDVSETARKIHGTINTVDSERAILDQFLHKLEYMIGSMDSSFPHPSANIEHKEN